MEEYIKTSEPFFERPFSYCPEKCDAIQKKLDECAFGKSDDVSGKQARFTIQVCRMNSPALEPLSKCISDSSCLNLPECFESRWYKWPPSLPLSLPLPTRRWCDER